MRLETVLYTAKVDGKCRWRDFFMKNRSLHLALFLLLATQITPSIIRAQVQAVSEQSNKHR
jgi:hypothetical protein